MAFPVTAQAADTVAVLPFEVASAEPEHAPLGRGLANMLITDLARSGRVRVVERERLDAVVQELELQGSGFVDPKTAVSVGKGIGADGIIVGGLTVNGELMRLDARVIDVETGVIVGTAEVEGKAKRFFDLEEKLVRDLTESLGVALSEDNRGQFARRRELDLDAGIAYGEAVVKYDQGADVSAELERAVADASSPWRLKKSFNADIKPLPPFFFAIGLSGSAGSSPLPGVPIGTSAHLFGQIGWAPSDKLHLSLDVAPVGFGAELRQQPAEGEPVITTATTYPARLGLRGRATKVGMLGLFVGAEAGGLYGTQTLTAENWAATAVTKGFGGASVRASVQLVPILEESLGLLVGLHVGVDIIDYGESTRMLGTGRRTVPTAELRLAYIQFGGGR